jgi:hypothetical protein
MRRRMTLSAAALFVCLPLQPLLAQLGGAWSDKYGRSLVMHFGGVPDVDLPTGTHSLEESAQLFRRACVDARFDRAATAAAAEAAGWGLRYQPVEVAMKPKPLDLGGWTAPGAALLAGAKLFFAPNAQCNLVVRLRLSATPGEVEAALSSALGAAPANKADAVKRNGQPNNRYEPIWILPGAPPMERAVFARQSSSGNDLLHLTVMERKAKSR